MLLFAKQKQKKSCLVVTDQDPAAADYSSELGTDLSNAVEGFGDISIIARYPMELPPSEQNLQTRKPDCILYAGHMGKRGTIRKEGIPVDRKVSTRSENRTRPLCSEIPPAGINARLLSVA